MLNKLKGMGSQIGTLASDAVHSVDEATASALDQAHKLATATESGSSAVTEEVIRKAVRRLQRAIRIATDELQKNPPSRKPMQLLAAFQVGITYMELTVEIDGSESGAMPVDPDGEATPASPGDESEPAPE